MLGSELAIVSRIRREAMLPDPKVITATASTAHTNPKMSASNPDTTAPIA
jgi:hypothetical protein